MIVFEGSIESKGGGKRSIDPSRATRPVRNIQPRKERKWVLFLYDVLQMWGYLRTVFLNYHYHVNYLSFFRCLNIFFVSVRICFSNKCAKQPMSPHTTGSIEKMLFKQYVNIIFSLSYCDSVTCW